MRRDDMKKITILFGPNGERIVEAHGFTGPECKQESAFIENALGSSLETRQKAEWYMENSEMVRESAEMGFDSTKLCG